MEQKKLNLRALFELLDRRGMKYFLIKTDAPYMVDNFPDDYPVGKDIDMICLPDQFTDIKNDIFSIDYSDFDVRVINQGDNYRVRFEEAGKLHYQIDLTCRYPWHLDEDFLRKCMENRVKKNGYYVLPPEYELGFRLYETVHDPQKKHHQRWVREHLDLAREDIIPSDLYRYLP